MCDKKGCDVAAVSYCDICYKGYCWRHDYKIQETIGIRGNSIFKCNRCEHA